MAGLNALRGDLFGDPVVPGLATVSDVITPAQERALIGEIESAGLAPFRFQRWTGNRQTRNFGWAYDFEEGKLRPADPFPPWLQAIRRMVAAATGLDPEALVHGLLTRYGSGAGIGWHRDRPIYEHVVGLSLGAPAMLRLRRRRAEGWSRASIALAPRALYRLSGEVRHEWEHSIAPMQDVRWSITLRTFSARGVLEAGRA